MQYSGALDITRWPVLSQIDWEHEVVARLLMSVTMVLVLWVLRVVLARVVRRKTDILSADQRRWTRTVKNMVWMLIVLGLVLIWAPQLRTVALSLAAFVVAIVIATKEVILCFTGAFMRVSTAPFRMGDWITIDGITGEVVDINPFSAKLQELETEHGTYAFTGRIVQIPNSRYFTAPIVNISHLKHYRVYLFTVSLQEDRMNPAELAVVLREIVQRHAAPFKEEATQARGRIARNSSIPLPDVTPQVTFAGGDFNNQRFTVRLFAPTRTAVLVASAIHEEFATRIAAERADQREKGKAWEVEKDVRVHERITAGDKAA